MQIKISDMLDNASELIEENNEIGYETDNDRIKEIVFSEINYMRKKQKKKKCAVALIAILGFGSISIGAKALLRSAGIIGDDRNEIMQPQIAHKVDENADFKIDHKLDLQTDLISQENLYEDNIPIAKHIIEIPVSTKGNLPECYLDNGAMIILTKSNKDGWDIEKKTRLSFEFMQERIIETDMAQPGVLELGYIFNGELKEQQIVNQNYCSVDFSLESEGTYYFYLKNCSSDRIIITKGTISQMQEE